MDFHGKHAEQLR